MEGVDYLAHERNKAQFDVDEMKIVWAGSRHAFDVSDRMARLVASDPVFQKDNRAMLSRKVLFKNTLRKAAHAWKRIIELRLSEEEANQLRSYVDEPAFTDLHWGMFVPAIKGQGTEDQQQKWLPLAHKMQIIGCYAQTELGHGSNVQGLETTATFDPATDEFVIHSPTLTSSKWWPGGLGKVSTHAVVYARLITGGQEHGVHGFIVQLRSLDDHMPLPGITVGDIGMKFGSGAYNTMDNGVLRFDHVRIPRNQMLMRVMQVTREGKCVQSNVPRQLIYGTMVYVRQTIVSDASSALSRAVCIATRYSAVRRQFGSQDGGIETQVARFLMKTVSQLGSGKKPVGTTAYMARAEDLLQCHCIVQRAEDWSKPSVILEAFEARAFRMCVARAQSLSKFPNPEEGFAELSADLAEAAIAHCQLIVVSKFIEKLEQDIPGKGVKQQLEILCNIYALNLLHKHLGDFLSTGCITPKQASLANDHLRSLYSQVRPNAIALVDAFNYTDHYLGSVLGRYDGNVYQKLYEAAWKDPLNDSVVPDGYQEYIRPMLKQQLRNARL
uniref:Acyl-coenzyme A oxidase n=1 Tax=Manihot esculenta TaxID=3983 RepID=A0A2C9WLI3_MANES